MKLEALAAALLASTLLLASPWTATALACGGYGQAQVEDPRIAADRILEAGDFRDPQIRRVMQAGRSAEIDFIHYIGAWAIGDVLHLRLTDAGTWVEDVPTVAAK